MQKMRFRNPVNVSEILENTPFGAEYVTSVSVSIYGYVHDVGVYVDITPIRDGENPQGWDTLAKDLAAAWSECESRWNISDRFGYH